MFNIYLNVDIFFTKRKIAFPATTNVECSKRTGQWSFIYYGETANLDISQSDTYRDAQSRGGRNISKS
jgi:hypothetical protein